MSRDVGSYGCLWHSPASLFVRSLIFYVIGGMLPYSRVVDMATQLIFWTFLSILEYVPSRDFVSALVTVIEPLIKGSMVTVHDSQH